MHKDVMGLLGRLGLKDRESRIYLACLRERDGLFVFEIAKATRVTRSTVDLTVRRLVQRGFLNKVKVGRRLRYFAQPPEAVLFRQKQLVEDLEQVVPMLATIGGQKKDTEIFYFEGSEGFRQVFDDILLHLRFAPADQRDLLAFSSGADSLRLFPNVQKIFIDKRIKAGAWYKAIATHESMKVVGWDNDPKALRRIKYMPPQVSGFRSEMAIYTDNVVLYSPVKPIGGVIIRNEKIAASMRALFTLVWGLLPEQETAPAAQ